MYNFKWFFAQFGTEGSIMKEAFLNTFMWWGISLCNTVVGVFTSYFIYKKITGHKIFRLLFCIPGLLSPIVMAFIVSRMLSAQGFVAQWVQQLQGLEQAPDLLYDERFVKSWLIIKGLPFAIAANLLIWVGTMSRIPDSVIESGKIDGASWGVEMFQLVIPMILPVVGITLCQSISGLFSASGGEFLYTKGQYGTMTLSTYLYLQIYNTTGTSNSHHQASAVGWMMTIIIAPLILITRRILNKIGNVEY
jgi:ABC-type sugar transport system permease subunit